MRPINENLQFSELDRSLFSELKEQVQRYIPGAEVVLYGSAAGGTNTSESDFDILILADEPLLPQSEDTIRDAVFDLEMSRGVVISTQFISKKDWDLHRAMPFLMEINRDGVVL